jgi:hypothetical protein
MLVPDRETWKETFADLCLTESQADSLEKTVCNALQRIGEYEGLRLSSERERDELVRFMMDLAKHISKLVTLVEGKKSTFNGLIAALRLAFSGRHP